MTEAMYYDLLDTPIGTLLLVGRDHGLAGVYLHEHAKARAVEASWRHDPVPLATARRQLTEYFAGDRKEFDLRLHPDGTPFQLDVWQALQDIPWGAVATYGEIADDIGRPGAARAVGAANGRNPISIVIPCHRVIAAGRALGGYGWGLDRKRWLLAHEGAAI